MIAERPGLLVAAGRPAGSTTVLRLAAAGLDVLLGGRARFPREQACAEYASPQVARLLRETGAGLIGAIRGARPLRGMRIDFPHGAERFVAYDAKSSAGGSHAARRAYCDAALLGHAAT